MSEETPRYEASVPRAHRRATVASGFVTGMLAGMRLKGMDPALLLGASGAATTGRVPLAAYTRLYNLVVQQLDDEGFGLFSAPLRAGTFEFLCRGLLGSRDVGEGLGRAIRYLRIVLPDLRVSIRRERGRAILEIAEARRLRPRASDRARVFAFEWLLRLLHGITCWMAGRNIALDEVRFPYPRPEHAADYARIYTERAMFGAKTLAAYFDAAVLDVPMHRDVADLEDFLAGAPGRISMLYRRDREAVRAVREYIAARLAHAPSLAEAARELHVAPRTLHRRLREEGTTFREIKDAVRREAALARVREPRVSVAQLASELGYSEPSAFFRAFQGWTGEAPTAHRKRHAP
jgi:AraC-like DNA-binding protein